MKDWFKKLKGAFVAPPAPAQASVGQAEPAAAPQAPVEGAASEPAQAPPAETDVIVASPVDEVSIVDKAEQLVRGGQLEAALLVLDEVELGTAQHAAAEHLRARILLRQSRFDGALAAVEAAIAGAGERAEFVALRANVLLQAGRRAEAEFDLRRAAELGSDDSWTYLNLAYLSHEQGRHADAVDVIRMGLELCPQDPSLAAHLGRFLLAADRLDEADTALAAAALTHASTPSVHLFRSWVLRARGDVEGAAACMRRLIELDSSKADWHGQHAVMLVELGRYSEAEEAIVKAARLHPDNEALRKLGERIAEGARRERQTKPKEAVRLVIWDLDDTFWHGTVTEGGIREYMQAHHDLVIELARRGIMSSICSKNDEATIARILEERGIAEYFIFPSISWEPKGPRIEALIETVQLRPATVMFIDDNHLNRAEAARMVPGLQVEDEHFIARLLDDPRFKGKDDSSLSRLAQYKLLERRKQDEVRASAGGSNEEFLRGCDIRVHIDYDVLGNLDRAVELVNRTNQLNFTKRRLPEDPEQARAALKEEIRLFFRQAGLVRVTDRYGDYGYVGFFVTQIGASSTATGHRGTSLQHFCFSCRTLGMLVEKWVYDYLGQPELQVVGEVLTDVSVPRSIDWITLGDGAVEGPVASQSVVAPEIRILGGCEANPLGFYLNSRSPNVVVRGNFASNPLFFRFNGADLILSYADRIGPEFAEEAVRLGLPEHLAAYDLFGEAPPGTALVVNCTRDFGFGVRQFRHKERPDWVVAQEVAARPLLNLITTDWDQLREGLAEALSTDPEARQKLEAVAAHLRRDYVYENEPHSLDRVEAGILGIIARVRPGVKLVFVLDHHVTRDPGGRLIDMPTLALANDRVRAIASGFAFVGTVSFSDAVKSDEEIQPGGNHYDRPVYLRLAEALATCITELDARPQPAAATSGVEAESLEAAG